MYRIIILFFFLVFSWQCKDTNPDLLLPEDELIPILADLYSANMAVAKFPEELQDSVSEAYRTNISDIYNVDILIIDSCVRIIQGDPKLNFEINDKVLQHFEQIKKEGFSPINEDD